MSFIRVGICRLYAIFEPPMSRHSRLLFVLLLFCICAGCASVANLEGGKKDTQPPKLVSITPADSQLNTRVNEIVIRFDEFIALNDVAKEIQISPLLSIPPTVTSLNKKVTVKIPDSLLQENTTYRITFGASVKDIHEDNKISGLTYIFSTGNYFDSLEVRGKVISARTGLPDTGVVILLYNASVDDSAIIRSRPLYIGRVEANGSFAVKGLPAKQFRIYGLKDGNDNLIYDGGQEKIAFQEELVKAGDTFAATILLRTFEEIQDTSMTDSVFVDTKRAKTSMGKNRDGKEEKAEELAYTVAVDTSNVSKRSKEIIKPLEISFNRPITEFNAAKITMTVDSTTVMPFTGYIDSVRDNVLVLTSAWKEDAVYTLRLLKGFAKDSAGIETMPSKYIFHTKRDDDYSKMKVNLPGKYMSNKYVLLIKMDKDTIYNKPVSDTTISIKLLQPGSYNMRIIVDENENGMWDTGDLLLKKQPELVIPYAQPITLKAAWENVIDFEITDKPQMGRKPSPDKRDRDTRK